MGRNAYGPKWAETLGPLLLQKLVTTVSHDWSLKNLENRLSCLFLILIWTNTFRFVDFFPNDK